MAAIHKILHPTDFSDHANSALQLAQRLAHDHGARLIVLHVVPSPVAYGEMGMTIPLPEIQQEILEERRIEVENLVAGTDTECQVVEGAAAREINRIAGEMSCDLIVIGTHGRGAIARVLLGSVAVDVMRQAPCAVLAVKGPGAHERSGGAVTGSEPGADSPPLFPVILVPIDFSERSRHAFGIGCALARGGSRLIILHVVEVVHVASEGYEEALKERLRTLQPDAPSIQVEYRLREGEPAEEILREAAASSCDLIILGTHGRAGLDRLVMGSIAEAVLRRTRCPVAVVKAPALASSDSASPLAMTIP